MAIPVISAVEAVQKMKKKCPRCHKEQLVSFKKKDARVNCKFCGATIPLKHK